MTNETDPIGVAGETPAVAAAVAPSKWPDPNAPRTAVDSFVRRNAAAPAASVLHEVPPVENGPLIVCNACGVVRISPNDELGLCGNCREGIGA